MAARPHSPEEAMGGAQSHLGDDRHAAFLMRPVSAPQVP
jgi:hypothetical protein